MGRAKFGTEPILRVCWDLLKDHLDWGTQRRGNKSTSSPLKCQTWKYSLCKDQCAIRGTSTLILLRCRSLTSPTNAMKATSFQNKKEASVAQWWEAPTKKLTARTTMSRRCETSTSRESFDWFIFKCDQKTTTRWRTKQVSPLTKHSI